MFQSMDSLCYLQYTLFFTILRASEYILLQPQIRTKQVQDYSLALVAA